MIKVVEARVTEVKRIPICCEFCGGKSIMEVSTTQVGAQIMYRANLEICCDDVRDRANEMDLEGFEGRGLPN